MASQCLNTATEWMNIIPELRLIYETAEEEVQDTSSRGSVGVHQTNSPLAPFICHSRSFSVIPAQAGIQ